MSDVRAKFEEIWPAPEGVYWMPLSRNGGEYMADPTIKGDNNRIEAQLSAEEWDARLDTFTRCQELIGAERDQLKALLIYTYNRGYMAGHHATVEGQFTDIHQSDMNTYHDDVVSEIVAENDPGLTIKKMGDSKGTIGHA